MSRVCNYSNTTGDSTSGAETAYPYGTHEFTSVFRGVRVIRSLVLRVMFCRSLFVPLHFAIVLSVLRFTNSDFPFGIFKLFFEECHAFCIFRTTHYFATSGCLWSVARQHCQTLSIISLFTC
jgi:hypothetical protein